jgi:SAM-dependent methyltransferase
LDTGPAIVFVWYVNVTIDVTSPRGAARTAPYTVLLAGPFVEDSAVALAISNCVNLTTDKVSTFKEIYRILKNGGRMIISDLVISIVIFEFYFTYFKTYFLSLLC